MGPNTTDLLHWRWRLLPADLLVRPQAILFCFFLIRRGGVDGDIHIDFPRGSRFGLPGGCGPLPTARGLRHEEMTWRHLNFFQPPIPYLPGPGTRIDWRAAGFKGRRVVPWAPQRAADRLDCFREALIMAMVQGNGRKGRWVTAWWATHGQPALAFGASSTIMSTAAGRRGRFYGRQPGVDCDEDAAGPPRPQLTSPVLSALESRPA